MKQERDHIYVITRGAALPVGSAVQAPEPGADIPSEMVGFEILAPRLGSLQPEAAYSLTRRVPCRSSGPRMSVSLPAGEINERLPGERRVEAGSLLRLAGPRLLGPRKYKSRLSRQPCSPLFLKEPVPLPPVLPRVSPSDRREDWIIVLRLR